LAGYSSLGWGAVLKSSTLTKSQGTEDVTVECVRLPKNIPYQFFITFPMSKEMMDYCQILSITSVS
jgi:azurin